MNENNKIIVAITSSPTSYYLIEEAKKISELLKLKLIAVHINTGKVLNNSEEKLLNRNLSRAKELNINVISTYNPDVVNGILELAKREKAVKIIIGKPIYYKVSDTITEKLIKTSGDIDIYAISQPGFTKQHYKYNLNIFKKLFSNKNQITKSLFLIFVITILSLYLSPKIGYWSIGLFFLAFITVASSFLDNIIIFFNTILITLIWNFFFIPPRFTFFIEKIEDVIMNILLFIVAIITGSFNSKLKKNELLLKKKEKKLKDLYNTARIINEEKNLSDIFDKMCLYLKDSFDLNIKLYKLEKDNTIKNNEFISSKINEIINSYSQSYTFEKFYIFDRMIILPMLNKNVIKGIMVMDNSYKKNVDYISDILQDIASQIANKIEHIELLNLKNQLDLARESEKIYRVVLDSISHELRTPITSISTSASALCDKNIVKNEEVSEILVGDIVEASERLNRIIGNLLETIKFESGRLKLNFERNYITELIGTVSNKFKKNCNTHHLNIHIENNLPLIYFDFVLIEQVIYNLIYNAQLYTANGSKIYIKAFKNKNFITVHVEDNGNGIDEIDIDKLFNKFYRGHKSKTGGTGLGLSICKSIIELHNGTICCENRVEGGARFIINLPIDRI